MASKFIAPISRSPKLQGRDPLTLVRWVATRPLRFKRILILIFGKSEPLCTLGGPSAQVWRQLLRRYRKPRRRCAPRPLFRSDLWINPRSPLVLIKKTPSSLDFFFTPTSFGSRNVFSPDLFSPIPPSPHQIIIRL